MEYIERDAAIAAAFSATSLGNSAFRDVYDTVSRLRLIPAADVRPVVLCRDCKYFSELMYKGTQFEYGYCDRWADGTRMNNDDFCSRAAKREES